MTAQTTGEGAVAETLPPRNAYLAAAIADDFYSDRLDMTARGTGPVGWSAMPEVKAVAHMRRDGQRELTVRRFLTFVSAMDRARDSNRLWSDAAKMLALRPEAFDPAEASAMPPDQLREMLSAARVSQRHHEDSAAWRTIASSLHAGEGAVAELVEQGKGDARELLEDLRSTGSEGRPRYPLLRSPKLGPLWVRVMAASGGAEVKNIHIVPVAVDVQVRKVTENLGVASKTCLPMRKLRGDGQRELTVRRFLTFVSAMDRARDSNRLWSDAAKMLALRPEAFDPAEASAMPPDQLREMLSAARVSQRHHEDSAAWRTIASSLHAGEGAVAELVEQGKGDARELLKDLRSTGSEGRPRYPLLRGPKLGPLWVRVMAAPGGAEVKNIHVVPVAVDVQVRRVTENLGVASTSGLPMSRAKPVIRAAWKSAVDAASFGGPPGIAGTCAALDPALWTFGKYGCGDCEKAGRRVPIGAACQLCQWVPD